MTTDELTAMLMQLVSDAPPEMLATLIQAHTSLTGTQARDLAHVIVTHEKMAADVAAIAAKGGVVDIPTEFA